MADLLLGIDAGTSGIKVCAFRRDGSLVTKTHRAIQVMTPRPLWAEIDLQTYWDLVVSAVREVTDRVGPVSSVGLATTCPTTIVLDADDLPIRPGIVYLDGRAEGILREYAGADPHGYAKRTGNNPSTSAAWVANVAWLRRNAPESWAGVRRVTMLNGYLALKLTGRLAMEPTQASCSGLMDIAALEPAWSSDLARDWRIEPDLLPDIISCAAPVGQVQAEAAHTTGLPRGTPVALGAADTAAASFAVGLCNSGSAFESVGTSGVITFCLNRPDFDPCFLNRQHVLPGRWLAHGAMSTLGGAFGWLTGQVWPELGCFEEIERLAQTSVPGANGLVFLPYLSGERSPIWDAMASGTWVGLRLNHTRQDMIRAVFEGTSFGLRQILARGQTKWGWLPRRLLGVGGGARSRFWAQLKADVLHLEYLVSDMADAAALGAASLGGIAAGSFRGLDDPEIPIIKETEAPVRPGAKPVREAYDRSFRVYELLYPQLREAMHALASHSDVTGGHQDAR